jgi:hypothetical protein
MAKKDYDDEDHNIVSFIFFVGLRGFYFKP